MNSRLRALILYALGCALVLCVYSSLTPRSTFAQPNTPPASTQEHSGEAASPSARVTVASEVHASASAAPSAHDSSGTPSEQTGVVNLNTATASELERLPRIGPARAQAILALRAQLTRFSKVEQLLRVRGIGRSTFRKLRPMLALDGPTTLPERKAR